MNLIAINLKQELKNIIIKIKEKYPDIVEIENSEKGFLGMVEDRHFKLKIHGSEILLKFKDHEDNTTMTIPFNLNRLDSFIKTQNINVPDDNSSDDSFDVSFDEFSDT